jgi:hypothetical protein
MMRVVKPSIISSDIPIAIFNWLARRQRGAEGYMVRPMIA